MERIINNSILNYLLCTLHTLLPSQSAAAMTACSPSRDPAVYTRHQLLGLRCVPGSKSKVYVNEVAIHGLLRYRGNVQAE